MRRLLPHPFFTPALAGIWLLLVNSATSGQLLLGLVLGWAIPLLTLRFWPETVRVYRPLTLIRFVATVLYDILVANLMVARLILGRPERLRPVFVVVPLALKSDLAITLLANAICLAPGSVSAHLTLNRRHLLVHALDTADPDQLVATIKNRYETPLREVFEPC